MVESYPSNVKPYAETTTAQPNLTVNNTSATVPSVPIQSYYYSMPYSTYVDPYTFQTYVYDPKGQYDPSRTNFTYDYSPYYMNSVYMQRYLF